MHALLRAQKYPRVNMPSLRLGEVWHQFRGGGWPFQQMGLEQQATQRQKRVLNPVSHLVQKLTQSGSQPSMKEGKL